MDQTKAMDDVGEGEYNFWKISNGTICHQDGTINISLEKDDKGEVTAVFLEKNKYIARYIYVLDVKVKTRLVFTKGSTTRMVQMGDRLYIYETKSDGTFNRPLAMVGGKKEGKFLKEFDEIIEFNTLIEAEEKALIERYTASIKLEQPEKFYKKVYDASEGYKKVVQHNGKVGFLNEKNEIVIPCIYTNSFNYFIYGVVGVNKDNLMGLIDVNNKEVVKIEYEQLKPFRLGLLPARKNGKFTLFDSKGKVIFDDLDYAEYNSETEKYYVRKGMDHGHFGEDRKINWFLKNKDYDELIAIDNGFISRKGEEFGFLNSEGKEIIAIQMDKFYKYKDDIYVVKIDKEYGYYKIGTGFITEVIYSSANDKGAVKFHNYSGTIDSNGNIDWGSDGATAGVKLNEPLDVWRQDFTSSGLLRKDELTQVERDGKKGFVDHRGAVVIPLEYDYIELVYRQGLIGVTKNGKKGFINESGEVIVPIEYDYLGSVTEEYSFAFKGKVKYKFDRTGKLVAEPADVNNSASVSGNSAEVEYVDRGLQEGVSFYSFDAVGKNEPFGNRTNSCTVNGTLAMSDGNVMIVSNIKGKSRNYTLIYPYDRNKCAHYELDGWNSSTAGCEIQEGKFVLGANNKFYVFQIVNAKLKEVKSFKFPEDGYSCEEMVNVGNNTVLSLWKKDKDFIVYSWNAVNESNSFYELKNVWNKRIFIDVSQDKTFATVVYKPESGNPKIDIFNTATISKSMNPTHSKVMDAKINNVLGAKITAKNEILTYLEIPGKNSGYNELSFSKFDKSGSLLKKWNTKALSAKNWTRTDAKSFNVLGSSDYLYFKTNTVELIKNERTGYIYVCCKMQAAGATFSYGPSAKQTGSGKAATDVPFLVHVNTETLDWNGFDFIQSMTNGVLHDIYGEKNEVGWLYNSKPVISSTPDRNFLILPENSSKERTHIWHAAFEETGKGGAKSKERVAYNTSSNSNNTTSSSSSSSSSNDNSSEAKTDSGPKFSGSISLKNDTGEQVYCWISTGGSGWISKGSSKTFSCSKGAKVYLSNSNSSSTKEFAFEATTDICGKTVKVSSYR